MTNAAGGKFGPHDGCVELPAGHVIRAMCEADLAAVHALECSGQAHPWSLQQLEDELHNRFSSIDLYCCGDCLAGFLCSWLIADELQIQNVVVSPQFRRQGIAARLLKFVMARSRRQGFAQAWLEVRAGNVGAIRLYEAFGFQKVDCRAAYYADGEDAMIMTYRSDDLPQ